MLRDERQGKTLKWLLMILGAILIGVISGLTMGWQYAPGLVLIYFGVAWGAELGQKKRRETEAYREQWLQKRKSEGTGPEGQG
ncbi:hypothetical protein [Arthrobacter crystallopoietes]|uniref:hypothetical protein n=1 Tax=Crystallibacter crystallopoietes TaxID=37928 RepID=UPI0011111E10|nr:hypothetical protein [Arthrobacter crystallopoietes]QTG81550.1 hypothetical protein J5251_02760 [Arthrobacter crystallopoietes]